MSKQFSLLRISGITLGAGLISFLLFYAIFGSWILALIVGVATSLFFATASGLLIVSINNREAYRRELERIQHQRSRQRLQEERYQFRRALLQGFFFRGQQAQKQPAIIDSELAHSAPPAKEEMEAVPALQQNPVKHKASAHEKTNKPWKQASKRKDGSLLQVLFLKMKGQPESEAEKRGKRKQRKKESAR